MHTRSISQVYYFNNRMAAERKSVVVASIVGTPFGVYWIYHPRTVFPIFLYFVFSYFVSSFEICIALLYLYIFSIVDDFGSLELREAKSGSIDLFLCLSVNYEVLSYVSSIWIGLAVGISSVQPFLVLKDESSQ